ncbi:MAG TPA: fatty acid--CoA ligase family protein [Pseudolabrys sp.]|nr:fatty acid--CoA ligase family protein [Pseudolabrys sp.]
MSALARILADALARQRNAIESASGEHREPAELLAVAARVKETLIARGVTANEPVHVHMANRPADLGSLLGVWEAGAVAVPVHVGAAASTRERVQRVSHARFALDGAVLVTLGNAAAPDRPLLRDAALVIFTSGSTGLPKGVVIGHQRLTDKLVVLDRLLMLRASDVVLCPLQITFIFGLWVSLLALMRGARLVLVEKFANDVMERSLAASTVLAGVPSMFRTLLTNPELRAPNLRLLLTGGEVLSPALAGALRHITPAAIHDLYGLTETGSCDFCLGPKDQPRGFGTLGQPTDEVSFRIADANGEVAPGEAGELQIDTPFGMLGYLDQPELTDASFADGYFKTGDLARLTPDGSVTLVGRAKDIISRGGHKIAPLEIDNLLAEHPDVFAALCAGVPDERLGEVIHAVIVPRAGAKLDAVSLRAWMAARTERFKVPDVFHFRDALPSGATGKADRKAVAQMAERDSSARS